MVYSLYTAIMKESTLDKGVFILNIVSPSILSADFARLADELKRIPSAQWVHFDVMDGHFVPNITVGMPVLLSVRKATHHFLDVHLMISDPLRYAPQFAKNGAGMICFHLESDSDPMETIRAIREHGAQVGIAIKPGTPVEKVFPYLPEVDMVLAMTVEPGFGGQAFIPSVLPKIRALREKAEEIAPNLLIQVDGGVNLETAKLCVEAGANVLVAGAYVFNSPDPNSTVRMLQRA